MTRGFPGLCAAVHVGVRAETGAIKALGSAPFADPAALHADRYAAGRALDWGGQRRRCGFRAYARCRSETGAPLSPRFNANFRARKKQMAANLWFAAGDFGGMCERGDSPLSQDGNDQSELARRAPKARKGVSIAGAKRRADPGRGPKSKQNYDRKLFRIMAPSGVRSTLIAGRRPALHGAASLGRVSRSRAMPVGNRRSWGGVGGAGFALTRDAGRRPALHGAALAVRVSRSRAMPVGDRRSWGGVVGAGFALTRDAGRRPALHGPALVVRVSRSRAMPVGDRRSLGAASLGRVSRSRAMPVGDRRSWGGVGGAGFALTRDAGRRPALLASLRFNAMGYFRARKKQMAANLWFAAGDFGGMCERGDSPLSQLVTTNRNSPKCASGARGSFDCGAKRRAVRKGGSPPTRPHLVSLPGSDAPLPNRFFAAAMKRGHWGVSGLFGGSQTLSTSCQASASGTPLRRVR